MATENEMTVQRFRERLNTLKQYLDIAGKQKELSALELKMAASGFWDNNAEAQEVIGEVNVRKEWVDACGGLEGRLEDIDVLLEMAAEEGEDGAQVELDTEFEAFEKKLAGLEFKKMLSGEDDNRNAIMTIHPGAGGTESQDWAQMLLRMYQYWIEKQGFKGQVLDLQPGEEAGIKSALIEVSGPYAYGYLKAETGIHRLVRISPFDSNSRRHTSFASIHTIPMIEDNIDVEINPKDLRIDTYRASGAGGQHVNKVSSAVRITHEPSGIVVQCQTDRSQHKNRDNAMKVLRARLYEYLKKIEDDKKAEREPEKKDIAWGNQIRSYVFHPYTMVKDHRTNAEIGDIQSVMSGNIQKFIEAYLTQQY